MKVEQLLIEFPPTVVEWWHGKASGYKTRKCRCDECLAYKLADGRRYRAENATKISAYGKTYEAKPEVKAKRKGKARAYRAANPEKTREAVAQYRLRNPETWKRSREKLIARDRAGYLAKAKLFASNRRARLRDALIVPFTDAQVDAKMAYWGNRCYMCGGPFEAVDHVKPLARGGAHCVSNLRPVCMSHNSSKKNRWHGVAWIAAVTGGVAEGQLVPSPAVLLLSA